MAVLVVDDEPIIRLGVSAELAVEGHATIEAGNAEEGLGLFQAHPEIGAAVVDIQLGGPMDGYALVRAIRTERPGTLVIIMSGMEFAPPPDFDEHVIMERKPCDPRKIGIILKSHVDRQAASAA